MYDVNKLVDKLYEKTTLSKEEWIYLIKNRNDVDKEHLFKLARDRQQEYYGKDVYSRGLIEFSNYCRNNCLYCGIRRDNTNLLRYRLTKDEILECAKEGYRLGYRTIVLQSGEDMHYTDDMICDIVSSIKNLYKDVAITLSIGEKSYESYQKYYDAGADRYLLRHESAVEKHYESLHPKQMSFKGRIKCIKDLKEIGYQVGCGFMVNAPGQKDEYLADEMLFLKEIDPAMVGIGPFIPHKDTPFKNEMAGTLDMTIFLLACIRLSIPSVLLPATTALGTISPIGRELGIKAGANVVMPNLSPVRVRKLYELYDNKICTGDEAAQCIGCLKGRIESVGYNLVSARGDSKNPSYVRR